MRLNKLVKVYVYTSKDEKIDGEISKTWEYRTTEKLNKQQDINELDVNSAGLIDYEVIKLRTRKDSTIEKNEGISFTELEEGEIPPYKVDSHTIIDRTHLIIAKSYYGN